MVATLGIVFPIFALVALGYIVVGTRYISQAAADGVNSFVLSVAMPILMFRTLATADRDASIPLLFFAIYFLAVLLVFAAGFAVARRLGGFDRRASTVSGVSAAYGNLVLVALPVIERVYGRDGLDILAILVAVHLPVMVIGSMLLIEAAASQDARTAGSGESRPGLWRTLVRVAKTLARHPLFIAAFAGLAMRFADIALPAIPADLVETIARTAGPLALIALGMSLPRYRISGALAVPLALGTLALLVQPLIVYGLGQLFLSPLALGVAVLAAASPSGVNSYLLAVWFKAGEQVAATMAVLTTAASLLTLTLWITVLSP